LVEKYRGKYRKFFFSKSEGENEKNPDDFSKIRRIPNPVLDSESLSELEKKNFAATFFLKIKIQKFFEKIFVCEFSQNGKKTIKFLR